MVDKEKSFSRAEIDERLASLPGWSYRDGAIQRAYTTNGWGTTLMVVNAIGFLCEAAGHHPDLAVSWSSVGVRLWTHSANGITDKDFEAARLIEQQVLWRPSQGSSLRGAPKEIVRGE
jgi:4a-hydroxytetrahydrobiopterin dehydratase